MAGKLKNIAVLATAIDSEAQVRMLKGIEHFAQEHGCNIAVFTWFTGTYEKEKNNLGELNIAKLPDLNLFDGVILAANIFHLEVNKKILLDILKDVRTPMVSIGVKLEGCYYVGADSYATMRQLVEHFVVDHGMRRLHFVKGTEGNQESEERFRAYQDVLCEYGIPLEDGRVTQGDFYIAGGERAAYEILNSDLPFPEAIICANDMMAIILSGVLQRRGYSIPEDVAVSGYDWTLEGQQCIPMLTTVKNCTDKQGEEACKLLLALKEGKEVPQEILVADEMVVGESCGCQYLDIHKRYQVQRNAIGKEAFQRNAIYHMLIMEKDIMEGEEYQDWVDALKNFIVNIDPPEFYCCVNEDFYEKAFETSITKQENMTQQERQAYSKNIKVQVAYQNGRFISKEAFPSCYALDELFNENEGGKVYIFSPLHYLDRNFGYMVFVDSSFPMENSIYTGWLINMGHDIENIRKQKLLYQAMGEMDDMYIRDSLTGVFNRFGMERVMRELKEESQRCHKQLFLAFADADGLKVINDKYGHEKGDHIIKNMARVLRDSGPDYHVVRYGGDEFVVLGLVYDETEVVQYWGHVEEKKKECNQNDDSGCILDFSYGYQLVPIDENTNILDCVQDADKLMYRQKNQKKQKK